jgi:hypothetical protein
MRCAAILGVLAAVLLTTMPAVPAVAGPVDLTFDVIGPVPSGPGVPPLPPIVVDVMRPGEVVPIEIVALNLQSINPVPLVGTQPSMTGADTGGGPGFFGLESFFDVRMEVQPTHQAVDVVLRMDVKTKPGNQHGTIVGGPGIFVTDSFFDVFVDISINDSLQRLNLQGTLILPNQTSFSTANTGVAPVGGFDSFFDVFVQIDISEPPPQTVVVDLLHLTLTGHVIPLPAAVWSGGGLLGLLAGTRALRRARLAAA